MSVCPYCWNHVSVYPLWKAGRPPDAFPQLFVYLFLLNVEVCMSEFCFFFFEGGSFCLFLVFCTDVCWWGLRKIPARPVGPHLLSHSTGKEGGPLWRQQWLWLIIKRKEKKRRFVRKNESLYVCVFFFFLFVFLYAHNANWLKSSCKGLASTFRPVLLYCLHWDSSRLLIISCIFYILFLQSDAICFFVVRSFVFLSDGFTTYMFRPGVLVDRCLCTVMLLALVCTSWGSKSGL